MEEINFSYKQPDVYINMIDDDIRLNREIRDDIYLNRYNRKRKNREDIFKMIYEISGINGLQAYLVTSGLTDHYPEFF